MVPVCDRHEPKPCEAQASNGHLPPRCWAKPSLAEGHSIRTPTSQATARSRVRVTQRVRLQRRRSNTQRVQRARCSERAAVPDVRPPATAARCPARPWGALGVTAAGHERRLNARGHRNPATNCTTRWCPTGGVTRPRSVETVRRCALRKLRAVRARIAAARLATRRRFLRVATPGELRADLAEANSEPRSLARGGLVALIGCELSA